MGLTVKKNKQGLFQLISTISDQRLHTEKWISEHDAKKILINRAFWRFFDEMMEIDMEFPGGYSCEGKLYPLPEITGAELKLKMLKAENKNDLFEQKYLELKQKYDLEI